MGGNLAFKNGLRGRPLNAKKQQLAEVGGASHDVTAEVGFLALLDLAMRLVLGGIIVGAPCVPSSSS